MNFEMRAGLLAIFSSFSLRTTAVITLFMLALTAGTASAASPSDSGVLGFQAWKTQRLDEARGNIEKLMKLVDHKSGDGTDQAHGVVQNQAMATGAMTARAPRAEQKLQQAQLALEIAQELTVNDYFVLYLSQFKNNREAFLDAAKKLSPDESADLLMSYQKHLAGAGGGDDSLLAGSGLETITRRH